MSKEFRLIHYFNLKIQYFFLRKMLSNDCGRSVTTIGDEVNQNNCFWIGFFTDNKTYVGLSNYQKGFFYGRKYIQDNYVEETKFKLEDLVLYSLNIQHYYKYFKLECIGIYRFLLSFIPFRVHKYFVYISDIYLQYFFNKRSLKSKKRYEFLKFLVDNFSNVDCFDEMQVIALFHSNRVFAHPSFYSEHSKVNRLLEYFEDTGELSKIDGSYKISGYAFKVIDEIEEEDRKHKSSSRLQIIIIFLTIIIALSALVDAKIIKIATLLEY